MIRLDRIGSYTENNRIEAKKAAGGLPRSLWETYSAFANTFGGIILLGVEELPGHVLHVSGIKEPEKMLSEFWNIINDKKQVSVNILDLEKVRIEEIESKKIITIEVPRAPRQDKPVYLSGNPYSGSYRRCGEGDYHCSAEEVSNMIRDQENGRDSRILKNCTMAALDQESIARYREKFAQINPGHIWLSYPQETFLIEIGAAKKWESHCAPTAAGLLMFGQEPEIVKEFPGYFLDYRERRSLGYTWSDRILSQTGDWSGNLCDFFFCVYDKIIASLMSLLGYRIEEKTPMQDAIQEALANALIHADYDGGNGLVIEKNPSGITITNPGSLRMSPDAAISGDIDQRNASLAKLFALVGVGHGKGGGLRSIQTIWEKYQLGIPSLKEQINPDFVILRLTIETDVTDEGVIRQAIIDYLTDHIEGEQIMIAHSLHIPQERAEKIFKKLLLENVITWGENDKYRLKR